MEFCLAMHVFMYESTKFQGAIQYRGKTISKCDIVIFMQLKDLRQKYNLQQMQVETLAFGLSELS